MLSVCIALAIAFWTCSDGFISLVAIHHIPRSFSSVALEIRDLEHSLGLCK